MDDRLLCALTCLPPWHYDSAINYAVNSLELPYETAKCMKACLLVGWLSSNQTSWEPVVNNTLEVMKHDLKRVLF